MWHEIAAWQEALTHRPDLSAKTIALYTQDVNFGNPIEESVDVSLPGG
jgi:hypothetical protein